MTAVSTTQSLSEAMEVALYQSREVYPVSVVSAARDWRQLEHQHKGESPSRDSEESLIGSHPTITPCVIPTANPATPPPVGCHFNEETNGSAYPTHRTPTKRVETAAHDQNISPGVFETCGEAPPSENRDVSKRAARNHMKHREASQPFPLTASTSLRAPPGTPQIDSIPLHTLSTPYESHATPIFRPTPSNFRVTSVCEDGVNISGDLSSQAMGSFDAASAQWVPGMEPARKAEEGAPPPEEEGKSRSTHDTSAASSVVDANTRHSLRDEATMTTHGSSGDEASITLARNGTISAIGTPSTVSTVPSTDDVEALGEYRLDGVPSILAPLLQSRLEQEANRTLSWNDSDTAISASALSGADMWQHTPVSAAFDSGSRLSWTSAGDSASAGLNEQQRMTAFRDEMNTRHPAQHAQPDQHYSSASTPNQSWSQHLQQHQRLRQNEQHLEQHPVRPQHLRQQNPSNMNFHPEQHHSIASFHSPQHRSPSHEVQNHSAAVYNMPPGTTTYPHMGTRKDVHNATHHSRATLPVTPRGSRNHRPLGQAHHQHIRHVGHHSSSGGQQQGSPSASHRSSAEILKTLLRKKACLYEAGTSRAIALVTWLVGRELALELGYFSRQQLQSGVHACVADKIGSGVITRTKVNRCMQIILNSCFHYIIPRSDGTEEKGGLFRNEFESTAKDDSHLLRYLPDPWGDLIVTKEMVLTAPHHEHEEKARHCGSPPSTKAPSQQNDVSVDSKMKGDSTYNSDHTESKRAVLLCFNENVRSAENVFRCHNEFIRDTANASNLQLSAQEWRSFFGRNTSWGQMLWVDEKAPNYAGSPAETSSDQVDALGRMNNDELVNFRTSWCTKRYDHDHVMCGFGHAEINGGWLRRNPSIHGYDAKMCPFVTTYSDKSLGLHPFIINECPKGALCELAHSREEILYHPSYYKSEPCTASMSRSGSCPLGDICPRLHSGRHFRHHGDHRFHGHNHRHGRKSDTHHGGGIRKPGTNAPVASPVIYADPAPLSSYELHLETPGLKSLFRRHSSVIRSHVRSRGKATSTYNVFGDSWGVADSA